MTVLSALAAVLLVTATPAAAFTLPKGAAQYTIYDLPKAWQISEGAGVTVAVIDSGVQTSIGDLRGQTVRGVDYTGQDPGADRDDPKSTNYGHGTDMAAKIAGNGQGGGMVGVAPKAKIMPMDVGRGGPNADTSLIPLAIRGAVDRGVQVINISIAAPGSCDPEEGAAIKYAYQHGVIVVAAAGDTPGPVGTPADCPGALAIGGVDANGQPWTNTPSGPEIDFVSLAYNLVNEQLNGTLGGPYPGNSGTSASAAFVSGMFALLISHFPHESARQIVARALYNTHTGRGVAGIDKRINNTLGYGELLPYYALTATTPASAPNPIYDRFDQELGPTSTAHPTNSSSSGTSTSASPAPGSSGPSSTPAAASSSSGSGFPAWAIVVIILAVLVIILLIVLITRRGRHTPTGPGGPYNPGGYGPTDGPGGYGPGGGPPPPGGYGPPS